MSLDSLHTIVIYFFVIVLICFFIDNVKRPMLKRAPLLNPSLKTIGAFFLFALVYFWMFKEVGIAVVLYSADLLTYFSALYCLFYVGPSFLLMLLGSATFLETIALPNLLVVLFGCTNYCLSYAAWWNVMTSFLMGSAFLVLLIFAFLHSRLTDEE